MADGARPLVLTDIPGQPGGFWGEHTTRVAAPRVSALSRRFLGKGAADRITGLAVGILLFLRQYRARALVTDGATASGVLATLQTIFPWGRRPHVMIAQLYVPPSRWAYRAKRVQLAVIDRSVTATWCGPRTRSTTTMMPSVFPRTRCATCRFTPRSTATPTACATTATSSPAGTTIGTTAPWWRRCERSTSRCGSPPPAPSSSTA